MFEVSVIIEPIAGNGFRATCSEPLTAVAEGASREEAIERLRTALEDRLRGGAEVIRLRIGDRVKAGPIWPDDALTAAWLQGITDARAEADRQPDPWDGAP
jgi:hypothetical protein